MAYDESIYRPRDPDRTDQFDVGDQDDPWHDPGPEPRSGQRLRGEASYQQNSGYRPARLPAENPSGTRQWGEADESEAGQPHGSTSRHRAAAQPGEPAAQPGGSSGNSGGPAARSDPEDEYPAGPAGDGSGRDRFGVHILWETTLLLAVVVLAFLLFRASPETLRGAALDSLLVTGAALGLLVLAAGLSLRAGAPNLAIGPVAIASAVHLAENGDRGIVTAMLPATVAVLVIGLVTAFVVVGLHVPGWAASLAGGLAVIVFIQQRTGPVQVQGEFDPTRTAIHLFAGFAAVALLGGVFGAIRTVRHAVGRFRPVADPARRPGGVAAFFTGTAIVASMLLAMLGGALIATNGAGTVTPTPGIEWTGLAVGVALLGGTSAFGRRGGIFGTLLAVVLLTLFNAYADDQEWHISRFAVAAVTLAAGLVVTRLVESYGVARPGPELDAPPPAEEAWTPGPNWRTGTEDRPEPWSTVLPVQPVEHRPAPWSTDRWDSAER
ncbi:hypothetical protein GCM10027290_35360 [Micromonospora sonneratiae]|uniref:ABC transporter permease n=1 Tax=Micromonospora sonneratiae TaxID=1184706 RepID=A0ABW3Y8M0_9ACTN